jgi:uncharacterized protein YlxW (UPF0749 family)
VQALSPDWQQQQTPQQQQSQEQQLQQQQQLLESRRSELDTSDKKARKELGKLEATVNSTKEQIDSTTSKITDLESDAELKALADREGVVRERYPVRPSLRRHPSNGYDVLITSPLRTRRIAHAWVGMGSAPLSNFPTTLSVTVWVFHVGAVNG